MRVALAIHRWGRLGPLDDLALALLVGLGQRRCREESGGTERGLVGGVLRVRPRVELLVWVAKIVSNR